MAMDNELVELVFRVLVSEERAIKDGDCDPERIRTVVNAGIAMGIGGGPMHGTMMLLSVYSLCSQLSKRSPKGREGLHGMLGEMLLLAWSTLSDGVKSDIQTIRKCYAECEAEAKKAGDVIARATARGERAHG